jgi:hypothetical protein
MVRFAADSVKSSIDYGIHIEHLLRCWCQRYPQLQHIDMDSLAVSVAKCRSLRRGGTYATILSLKYPFGRAGDTRKVRHLPTFVRNNIEVLYILKIFLPRFHDLPVPEKVATLLHELYHIHPKFNGEFREFGGRCWAHGSSQRRFEMSFEALKSEILARWCAMHELFLDCNFSTLARRFGNVYGSRYRLALCNVNPAQTVARVGPRRMASLAPPGEAPL